MPTAGYTYANQVPQISEFPRYKGSARDLQPVVQTTPENTPASTEEPDIELTVIEKLLNEPVYSPFRREGTVKDSTRPVYVITGEEMEAQGAKTVREALKFLTSILPDGTVGTEVNALSGQFIRGSNSAQVLILLDGRPINELGSGGFDLSEFTTNIVERIEVLPGGGSTLYGSDAIGGVINIITRRPTEKVTTQAGVTFGAHGLNQQTINSSGKIGDIGWVVGYNRTEAENNYAFSIPEANFKGTRENNDVLYNNFNVKLEADLGKRNTLTLSTLYLGKDQGVPGGVPVPEPLFGQGYFNSLTDSDRNLRPEKGDSYDIGIDQKLGDFGLLRLTYFNNTISDLIAYNFAVPVATYKNIGKVRTTGIEAVFNLQLAKNIYAFVGYTANDPRILKSTNSVEVDKELRFAGADSLNAGLFKISSRKSRFRCGSENIWLFGSLPTRAGCILFR
ncbi:TonB-dependent receptor domain-containing protein [uncultured Nostoc sp.]|uniref:TonB-dependent receptor domain-containing protein n=1 Tax=uncultured Nostoc sp. TaxID=340711 RepID=UPI0035C94F53